MYGHNLSVYEKKAAAFGWEPVVIDGHEMQEVLAAYERAVAVKQKPVMIIAKTIKGKGVSFIEDKNGWHGKALKKDELARALKELGAIDKNIRGQIPNPQDIKPTGQVPRKIPAISYTSEKPLATRHAYGNAIVRIFPQFPNMVVLDGEVSNSTFSELFQAAVSLLYPATCTICGKHVRAGEYLCDGCGAKMIRIVPPFCEICSEPFDGSINTAFSCANCAHRTIYFDAAVAAYRGRGIVLDHDRIATLLQRRRV